MLCIICNKNPEKNWPKRWQCWKENGKFSESICKVLGLPKYPYEEDFQNSVFCSTCQKRVYNMYLTVRKWERILTDISKLKSDMEKDIQESLQKGGNGTGNEAGANLGDMIAAAGEEREKENGDVCLQLTGENEIDFEQRMHTFTSREAPEQDTFVRMNKLRKKILEKMSRPNSFDWNNSSCYDFEIPGGKSECPCASCHEGGSQTQKGHSQPEENQRQNQKSNDENEGGDASSSYYSSSDEGDEACDCSDCRNRANSKQHNNCGNMCSSEYCVDCTICNNEAKTTNQASESQENSGSTTSSSQSTSPSPTSGNEKKYIPPPPSQSKPKKTRQKKDKAGVKSVATVTKTKEKESEDDEQTKSRSSSDENIKPDVTSLSSKLLKLEQSFGYTATMDEITGEGAVYAERFRCHKSNCTRAFPTKEELGIHVKRHHEGVKCPYKCELCDKAFQWKRELDDHQLVHSGGVSVCCHLCGRGFRTQRLFGLHLKTKHASERKFKCTFCDKSFISQSKLKTHSTIHTREYPFKCTICDKGFSAKTFLSFHMSKHTDSSPYQCSTCDRTFSTPRNLLVHQYTHTQTHPYKCPVCQAGAPSETLLKKHMLKHNQEKSNACELCNKKFRFPSSLKKHYKVHEGDMRFHCQFCSKTFIDKYKLTRHLRTHSGERPHQCNLCQKSFATKDSLAHHIRKHKKASNNEITDNSSPAVDYSQFQTDETINELGIPEFLPETQHYNHNDQNQILQPTDGRHNILQDGYMQNSSDVMISSYSHSFFPETNPATFLPTSLPENSTNVDALVATLAFDNLAAPLSIDDVMEDASLIDLTSSPLIGPSYTAADHSDFLSGEYCGFSFQQL
ncbi:unnamed protein product [Orchesella dallaii]|uniref:C2H2-type domain-containing protein n=1 Tax=Orchesella dallaii TaxID=48710 RepID=A0ABP1Q820_9HEXA